MLVLPHVESTLMATDQVGLKLLQDAGSFECYPTWREAKVKGEVAASAAILNGGYNLDCLMLRYQDIDWKDNSKWRCGNMIAPHQEGTYDGTSLNPLEVSLHATHTPTYTDMLPHCIDTCMAAPKSAASSSADTWLLSSWRFLLCCMRQCTQRCMINMTCSCTQNGTAVSHA